MQNGDSAIFFDILIVAIVAVSVYTAVKKGVLVELFKCAGVVFAAFVSFHYYVILAQFFVNSSADNAGAILTMSFLVLTVVVILIVRFIRDGILLLVTVEVQPTLDRLISVVLGVLRGIITAGLLMYALLLLAIPPVNSAIRSSVVATWATQLSLDCYNQVYGFCVKTIFKEEPYNQHVMQVLTPTESDQRHPEKKDVLR